ncbi:MAG: hypothetical protein AAF304_07220 [Pseudomonadota bacterium]
MQQDIAKAVHSYLPEINASELNFDVEQEEHAYANDLNQFIEKIQSWSHSILEEAKLPTAANEAKALTTKYSMDSNEGCALHMVVELDSINKSIEQNDATTVALASMKLVDAIWHSAIFRSTEQKADNANKQTTSSISTQSKNTQKSPSSQSDHEETIALYQRTINDLKEKYPHCNVNALRLLASTRLNVGKQELDELDITPE